MTDAQRAEATTGMIRINFRGDTYNVDLLAMTWDVLAQDEAGNISAVLKGLLGEEQFAKFTAANPHPLERGDDGELVSVGMVMRDTIIAAMGNPAASSRS
jgi:hypothetical protein